MKKVEPSRSRKRNHAETADLRAEEVDTLNVDHKADAPIDDAADVEAESAERKANDETQK